MPAQRVKLLNISLARKLLVAGIAIVAILTILLLKDAGIHEINNWRDVQGIVLKSRKHMEFEVLDIPSTTEQRTRFFCGGSTKDPNRSCAFFHNHPRVISLPDPSPMSSHMTTTPHYTCLDHGTRFRSYESCSCREGWYGDECDIPNSIYGSVELMKLERKRIVPRLRSSTARNIIYAALFNHEFDMLEALLHELDELVEIFIFLESIYTAFGVRKPLRLLPRLHRGYLREFHHKILYLSIDHFPNGGRKSGWISDAYLRSYLGHHGVKYINNTRDDDLIIVCDLDEIPSRDSVAFLKFHDGYPEPFGFRLRWSALGFFWKNIRYTQITAGCTIGMLRDVYNFDTNLVRDIDSALNNSRPGLWAYRRTHAVFTWFMGDTDRYAGWHCSGCFDPEGIRIKFMSAQNADFPRWGGMREKMDLHYIEKLIKEGIWFDGSPISELPLSSRKDDTFFAPSHMLSNFKKYKHILENPYRKKGTED